VELSPGYVEGYNLAQQLIYGIYPLKLHQEHFERSPTWSPTQLALRNAMSLFLSPLDILSSHNPMYALDQGAPAT